MMIEIVIVRIVLFVNSFFFQAEDGIRDLVRSRGLGDVYKRQGSRSPPRSDRYRLTTQLAREGLRRPGERTAYLDGLSLIHI